MSIDKYYCTCIDIGSMGKRRLCCSIYLFFFLNFRFLLYCYKWIRFVTRLKRQMVPIGFSIVFYNTRASWIVYACAHCLAASRWWLPSVSTAQHSARAGTTRSRRDCCQPAVAFNVSSATPTALAAASRRHGFVVSAHRFLTHEPRRGGMYGSDPHNRTYPFLATQLYVANSKIWQFQKTKQKK